MIDEMRVVIVEDDSDARANLQDILELEGCAVWSTGSIREALTLEIWPQVDLVILDRRLSDDLVDRWLGTLRRMAPRAAIVIVTAYADLDSTITALRYGAYDYLLKPINPEALRASLRRLRQLRDARDRALQSERLAAIGQTVAGLAHESRNALQRIQTSVEMLRLEIADRSGALELCGQIEQAVLELTRLHEQVRAYAAPIVLERQECNLRELWRHVWQELSYRHQDKKLRLEEYSHEKHCSCHVDPFAMSQVLRNLLENAIDASPTEGRIIVKCRNAQVGGQPAWAVTIQDEGPGIDPAQFDKVFEPFFTTKSKGTGLGLAIARRIMEAHGGKLVAEQAERGAALTMYVPHSASLGVPAEAHYFVLEGLPFG
ncbi:MAG: hypothetical protein KatS3mg110_0795 [Pirellulaceae bacterium]|nr:MAG: hypothetical protein KatS3mg110_0795 [Pirellulaceae bacterium]